MDYFNLFKENHIEDNDDYTRNDIGTARLFYDLHSRDICYVLESKSWYSYDGRRWKKDGGGLYVMEKCKDFSQALARYAESVDDGGENGAAYIKYTSEFHTRRKRQGLLADAKSVAPKSLAEFDCDRLLLNCLNGTFSLKDMVLRPHRAEDFITKISRVEYDENACCERWIRFIFEVMCGNDGMIRFLQKAFGSGLSGDTSLECFFMLYGKTTRNGKSTLLETVAYMLGEYAMTIQPQTLSRRSSNGADASPDTARLKGARLVNMPEPEKGLELNIALVKQLTGGDTYTARNLNESPVEFSPEFKLFINTNHLPRTSDDTIFTSGRVKLIPFDRHFTQEEQDAGLKMLFRESGNVSGILNWLIEGYRLMRDEGLSLPEKVKNAIAEYRLDADDLGAFFKDTLVPMENNRLKTSELWEAHNVWAKANGIRSMSSQKFVGELRRRYEVKSDCKKGNVIVGFSLEK